MLHLSTIYADERLCPEPEDDTSGLLAWVDDDGRFFCRTEDDRVVEVRDGEPLPLLGCDDPSPNEIVNYRLGLAIYALIGSATLMFIAQFVRAWLAGRF